MQNYFGTIDTPLLAADFDYFRIPPERWELMLARLRQMGLKAVTLTMPWGFHEFNQGTVDLNGATHRRRDVAGLLNLCSALDVPCILKPGPYSNRGVLGDGIPLWLLKNDDFETALPPAVEGWYKAMSKTLAGQQWPAGPVVAIHIDSETSERQTSPFSKQLTEVKWRIWLRKRYHGIEALNTAYGVEYRSVNDVGFPSTWSEEKTVLERDATEFLEKVRSEIQTRYSQILVDAGWQIPVYPSAKEIHPELPAIQSHSLTNVDGLSTLNLDGKILNLQHPIQVDPDPVEVGQGPVWANSAPIRMDGSLRQKFWDVRQFLWQRILANASVKGKTLNASFATASLVTRSSDASIKIGIAPDTKPTACRLRLDGQLVVDDGLRVRRGKLSGSYLAEDEFDRTDLVLILTDSTTAVGDFPLAYLSSLLTAQTQTLTRCAALAERLGQMLAVSRETPDAAAPERPAQTLTTLEEARRGLSEADAALRKAMASISGLEDGFATMLDQTGPEVTPQPAAVPVAISPEIFEDFARHILIEVGAVCTEIAPQLKSAAMTLQQTIDALDGFTVEQYRQSYATAVAAARAARRPLLEIIAQLRLEIASEKLPLLIWRIHDQVQEIAESLRWGVLRR